MSNTCHHRTTRAAWWVLFTRKVLMESLWRPSGALFIFVQSCTSCTGVHVLLYSQLLLTVLRTYIIAFGSNPSTNRKEVGGVHRFGIISLLMICFDGLLCMGFVPSFTQHATKQWTCHFFGISLVLLVHCDSIGKPVWKVQENDKVLLLLCHWTRFSFHWQGSTIFFF